MDRPPADPAKLLSSWSEWETGETLPGRVISNLKTGGLRDVVEHLAGDGELDLDGVDLTAMLETWNAWESGTSTPAVVAPALHEAGLRPLLEHLGAQGAASVDSR